MDLYRSKQSLNASCPGRTELQKQCCWSSTLDPRQHSDRQVYECNLQRSCPEPGQSVMHFNVLTSAALVGACNTCCTLLFCCFHMSILSEGLQLRLTPVFEVLDNNTTRKSCVPSMPVASSLLLCNGPIARVTIIMCNGSECEIERLLTNDVSGSCQRGSTYTREYMSIPSAPVEDFTVYCSHPIPSGLSCQVHSITSCKQSCWCLKHVSEIMAAAQTGTCLTMTLAGCCKVCTILLLLLKAYALQMAT